MSKHTIKTVALSSDTVKEVVAMGRNAIVRNYGSQTVYASSSADVGAGNDGTMSVNAGSSVLVRDVGIAGGGADKLYLKCGSATSVEVEFINDLNFKFEVKGGGGGGGEPVDAYTKGEVDGFLNEKLSISAIPSTMSAYGINDESQIAGMELDIANVETNIDGIEGDIANLNINVSDLSVNLANKVGFTDYATRSKAGVFKVETNQNYAYGLKMDNNGFLQCVGASESEIKVGSNDWKPITPYNSKYLMNEYGIDSKDFIGEVVASQIGENLIKCPYAFESGRVTDGIKLQYDEDGVMRFSGTSGTSSAPFLCRVIYNTNEIDLEEDYYTLTIETNRYDNSLFMSYVLTNDMADISNVQNVNIDNSKMVLRFDNRQGQFKFLAYISIRQQWGLKNINYNNVYVKISVEKGSVAHEYQPYTLSRQSLRNDVDNKVDNDEFVAENLLKSKKISATSNGVSISANDDGSYNLSGTSTASGRVNFAIAENVTYENGKTYSVKDFGTFSAERSQDLSIRLIKGADVLFEMKGQAEKTFTADERFVGAIWYVTIANFHNCDNLTIKLMVEKGSIAHKYQPYELSRKSLREDINNTNLLYPFFKDLVQTKTETVFDMKSYGEVAVYTTGVPASTRYIFINTDDTAIMLEHKKYLLTGCPDGGGRTSATSGTYIIGVAPKGSISTIDGNYDTGNGFIIDNTDGSYDVGIKISVSVYKQNGEVSQSNPMIFRPCLTEITPKNADVFNLYDNTAVKQLSKPVKGSKTTGLAVYRTGNVVSFTALVSAGGLTNGYVVATDMPTPVSNMAFVPVSDTIGTVYTNGSCWVSNDSALTYHGSTNNNACMITGTYICK